MSVTTQFTTFNDLYIGVLNAVRSQTSQASTLALAQRAVNVALQDMHLGQDYQFYWAERNAFLLTHPGYSTGTLTIGQGSQLVTATAGTTFWTSTNTFGQLNVAVSGKLKFPGDETVYRVATVPTAETLTLNGKFVGSSLTDSAYTYFEDEYALPSDYLRPVDMQFFDDNREINLIDRRQLRRGLPRNSTTGRPRAATQIELGPSASASLRPRIVFAPPPDAAYQIPFGYITNQLVVAADGTLKTNFTLDTDEPIVPLRYRHALYYYALKIFYEHKDDARRAEADAAYKEVMQRTLGDVTVGDRRMRIEPAVGNYRQQAERPYRAGGRFRRFEDRKSVV